MQQMASDIFVRILRGMGACRKKPAQPASGTLSWMTPSETLLRLCLSGFGDMKWAWGGGWRLPAFLCQTTSSPGFCPISRAHFRDRKTLRKRFSPQGASPVIYTECARRDRLSEQRIAWSSEKLCTSASTHHGLGIPWRFHAFADVLSIVIE